MTQGRSAARLSLRILAMALAVAAMALLAAILLGIPSSFGAPLIRFREPTWALWGALVLFAIAHERPSESVRHAAERARAILGSATFYGRMAAVLLALYLLVAIRSHLSFHTFSHDFSMFDEALYQSSHGRFLFAPVLGRSYLSEHFAPILAVLVPVHRFIPTPYLLVVVNAVLLWAAVLPLRSLLDSFGLSRTTRNLACLVYLTNPVTVAALDYGFHVEAFLPFVLFALAVTHRRGSPWGYGAWLLLALAIKEDVGLYLLGWGAFLRVAERRPWKGALTILVSAAYVIAVLGVVNPMLAGGAREYRFLSRWEAWGSTPVGIASGLLTHPIALIAAVAAPAYLLFFYRLVFTPFLTRWGWLLFTIPWVLGATSASRPQATLGLYYGLPLLSFAALAAAYGLASKRGHDIAASRLGPAIAALAIVLNVAHFTIQPIPPERRALLNAIDHIPRDARVQAMPSLYPLLGYERPKSVLMPGDSLTADYVLLRSVTTAWPFSTEEVERLAEGAIQAGNYEATFHRGAFWILKRRVQEIRHDRDDDRPLSERDRVLPRRDVREGAWDLSRQGDFVPGNAGDDHARASVPASHGEGRQHRRARPARLLLHARAAAGAARGNAGEGELARDLGAGWPRERRGVARARR